MASFRDAVGYGVLYVAGANHGFSEKYVVKTASSTTLSTAQDAFAKFVKFRQLILAKGTQIVWARVSMGDTTRQRLRCIDAPLDPVALSTEGGGIGDMNDMKSAIHIAFETAGGAWANRLVRGYRDAWVSGANVAVTPTVQASVVPGTDDVAGLTAAVAFGNFIRAVMQYTRRVQESTSTPGLAVFSDWSTYVVRGVTGRDTGRAFGSGRGRRAAGSI